MYVLKDGTWCELELAKQGDVVAFSVARCFKSSFLAKLTDTLNGDVVPQVVVDIVSADGIVVVNVVFSHDDAEYDVCSRITIFTFGRAPNKINTRFISNRFILFLRSYTFELKLKLH